MNKCLAISSIVLLGLTFACSKRMAPVGFDAKITGMVGDAEIFVEKTRTWKAVEFGSSVSFGDSIRTREESQIEITFNGANSIRLDEQTSVRVKPSVDSAGHELIEVFNGGGTVLTNVEKLDGGNDRFRVTTPTSVAVVKGTHFSVHFDAPRRVSHVHCLEGKVWVFNPFTPPVPPMIIVPGFFTSVTFGAVPLAPAHIPPGQWKKLHRVLPGPMFTMYTGKFKAKGIDHLLLLPGPFDFSGKHIKMRGGHFGGPGGGAGKYHMVKGSGKRGTGAAAMKHGGPGKNTGSGRSPGGFKPPKSGGGKGKRK